MRPRRFGVSPGLLPTVLPRPLNNPVLPAVVGAQKACVARQAQVRVCCALASFCMATLVQAQGARAAAAADAAAAEAAVAAASPASAAASEPLPVPVPLPPPPVVHAFQGLPWGASEAQIAQRFGAQLQQAQCAPVSRRQPERAREVCDHPYVPNYEVAGVPFRLTFHLDTQSRQLLRVTLSYAGAATAPGGTGGPGTTSNASADNRWGERHRVLRNLLAQRYGGPENSQVSNEPGSFVASARWRVNGTVIDLNSMFFHRAANGPAREQYDISYQPVTAGDAGKL